MGKALLPLQFFKGVTASFAFCFNCGLIAKIKSQFVQDFLPFYVVLFKGEKQSDGNSRNWTFSTTQVPLSSSAVYARQDKTV